LNLIWIMPAQGVSTLIPCPVQLGKGAITYDESVAGLPPLQQAQQATVVSATAMVTHSALAEAAGDVAKFVATDVVPGGDSAKFGVGARVTLAVMSDNYVDIIVGALRQADATGLEVQTGDVSTYVAGNEADILRYLSQLVSSAGRTGAHVSATILFSRGCPGEVVCDLPGGAWPLHSDIPELGTTGVHATAEWALYPLDDTASHGIQSDHMRDIYAAIDFAKDIGTFVKSEHFVTRLEGDVARVLETVAAGWILVGRTVQHVTSQATVSINSPTPSNSSPTAAKEGS